MDDEFRSDEDPVSLISRLEYCKKIIFSVQIDIKIDNKDTPKTGTHFVT